MTKYLTVHFTKVQNICSRETFPLSLFVPLCQALKNELLRGLTGNDNAFEVIFGRGGRIEIEDMISPRFNMDGNAPIGTRKVGLLDPHHFWVFVVDPFNHRLRSKLALQRDMATIVEEMINAYVPLDADGSSTSRLRVKEEFMVRPYCSLLLEYALI